MVALLASRIPDLKLDRGVLQAHRLGQKRGTNGALLVIQKLALDKTEHQTGKITKEKKTDTSRREQSHQGKKMLSSDNKNKQESQKKKK
jgi:hypothetical protein